MLLAPCDSRLSNWSCFSAHSWTKSFSSSSSVLSLLVHGWRRCTGRRRWGWCRHWAIFAELEGFWQRVSTRGRRKWAGISSIIKHVGAWQRIDSSWWILWIFVRKKLVERAGIRVVAKWERDLKFYNKVFSMRLCYISPVKSFPN